MKKIRKTGNRTASARQLSRLERAVADFRSVVEQRFDAVDQRFEAVDERLDAGARRSEAVDRRFEAVDRRFEAVDRRFNAVDRRFDAVDQKIESMSVHLTTLIESLRDDVRIFAEAHVALEQRVTRLETHGR